MASVHAVVRMPYVTGLPRDVSINTFNITDPDASALDIVAVWGPALTDYYTDTYDGHRIADYLSPVIVPDACSIEFYEPNLATGAIGEPINITPLDLGLVSDEGPMPLEVAICNSQRAAGGIGLSGARRRGKHYLGPWGNEVTTTSDVGLPAPANVVLNTIRLASVNLLLIGDTLDGDWAVWSRSDAAMFPVVGGWIDNEFDTQRRREVDATLRATY